MRNILKIGAGEAPPSFSIIVFILFRSQNVDLKTMQERLMIISFRIWDETQLFRNLIEFVVTSSAISHYLLLMRSMARAWVVKWAPFLRFGVTFVHANLYMHTFITFFVFVCHIEFFKKVPFFAKIVLFFPIWYGMEVSISTLVRCKDCLRVGMSRNKVFPEGQHWVT